MRLQEKSEQHGVVPYVLEKAAVPEDWILLEGGIGEGGRQTVDKRAAYLVLSTRQKVPSCPLR